MVHLIDRVASEIFITHIDSLSASRRLAERIILICSEEILDGKMLIEGIRMSLVDKDYHLALRDTYHLTPQEAMLLEHLVKREILSLSAIMALLQANNATSRVFISRLRQKTGLSIRNYRGEGYALRPESRKALISHIKGEPIK